MRNFADKLLDAVEKCENPSVIGLDSDFTKLPGCVKEPHRKMGDPFDAAAESIIEFNRGIIEAIKDIVPAVKIQSAFYEQYGPPGIRAFLETANIARKNGLIVIGDVKRNDIGNTSAAYSSAYLGKSVLFSETAATFDLDAITVNPYLGSDGIKPFLSDVKEWGKGIFVLVKTSNPSSSEIQDLACGSKKVYEKVGGLVETWGVDHRGGRGFSSVGAVVGATYPGEARKLRRIMPHAIFLVPGYGSQGGKAKDIIPCFDENGWGALIHSAREVIFAYQKSGKEERFGEEALKAALRMKDDISRAFSEEGLKQW